MAEAGPKKTANYEIRTLTMRDMVGPLFRNWRAVIATFCLIFVVAIFVGWRWAANYYVSSMQVVVSRERSDPKVTGQQNAALLNNESPVTADEVASEIALLQGRDMLEEVVRVCKLANDNSSATSLFGKSNSQDAEVTDPKLLEKATNRLASKLAVEAQKLSHVIDVKYGNSGAPETPACVLQTLAKLYLQKHVRLQRPAGTYDFFSTETDKYQHALEQAEVRLADFSKSQGIAAPDILRTDMAEQLVGAQAGLYKSRQNIAADQDRLENLKKQLADTPSRSSTAEASTAANTLLQQLHSSLLAAQLKRTQLLAKYDASYPLVKEADLEIAQTMQAIDDAEKTKYVNTTTDRDQTYEYLRQDQAKTEADLASEQATATELAKTIGGMQSEMVSLDVSAVKREALLREAKANEENYLLYQTKREQERTSDALDEKRIANVAIAVPAEIPALPARSPFSIILPGFFLALLGAIGAGYLVEFADPSFRTPAEVEQMLNVTVLGAVPKRVA
jgi:uncharacterized protein involved in exopolysaccharide biosynthesis